MKPARTALILLLALALIPFSFAQGEEDLAGRWTSDIQGDTGTLLLHSGGAFIMLYEDENITVDTGSWSKSQGQLLLMIQGGDTLTLEYKLEQDTLSTRKSIDEEWTIFTWEPWKPTEGLAGDWRGKDVQGDFLLTLGTDNSFSFDYLSGDPIGSGYYAEYREYLFLVFDNNTYLAMGYTMTDGGLTIRNYSTGDEFPLSRGQIILFDPTYPPETETPMPTPRPIPAITAAPGSVQTPGAVSGLAGSWQGTDAAGARVITFTESGELTIAYQDAANAAKDKKGAYTSTADAVSVEYPDGTKETYRYLILGDSLLLSDALLQNPVTYSRLAPPVDAVDPALPGTWGGRTSIGYFEFTFKQDGTYAMVVLPNESDSHTGTFTVQGDVLVLFDGEETEEIGYELDGDRLVLDLEVEAYRMSGPLVRETMPETALSAAADPALTGVWGGMEQGSYAEHIFFADGRYLRFTPSDEPETEAGNYLASGGTLAVLTREGSSQMSYTITGDTLTLSIAGGEETSFVKRNGILKRME